MKLFIIGPGGVGKSTAGKILAQKFNYHYIDLDQEFCNRIENISTFIQIQGYEKYCHENSRLFYRILNEEKKNNSFVFVLSSGFLVHENLDRLTSKHRQILQKEGFSILLLPSKSLQESMDIVVKRQLSRGFGLEENRERQKFAKRFVEYQSFGNVQIFSCESPEMIALEMKYKIAQMKK